MAAGREHWSGERMAQGGVLLAISTLALTASFLGVVGLVTGGVTGSTDRLPLYVLAMALVFVGSVLHLEGQLRDGERILRASAAIAAGTIVVVGLGGEGIAYVLQHPAEVLTSQLLFYFLAAGLIGTGLGYWALRHWNEISRGAGL